MPTRQLRQFWTDADHPRHLPAQTALQEAIHEPTGQARTRIILALKATLAGPLARSANKLLACSSTARFYVSPSAGKVSTYINRCRHKLCPFCAKARSGQVAADLLAILTAMKHPRTLILTVASTDTGLTEQMRFLRRSFAKLRRTPAWRERVKGGAYTVEVTYNPDTKRWHPHLHMIIDGTYFPVRLLQRLWHEITNGSKIVWIQDVHDKPGIARELAKYIGKPQRVSTLPADRIREYAGAVTGSRMVQTFGTSFGVTAVDEDPKNPEPTDTFTASLPRILHLAAHGAPDAQRLLPLIAARWPLYASYIYHRLPQLCPDASKLRKTAALMALDNTPPPPPDTPPETDPDAEQLAAHLLAAFQAYQLREQLDEHAEFDRSWQEPEP